MLIAWSPISYHWLPIVDPIVDLHPFYCTTDSSSLVLTQVPFSFCTGYETRRLYLKWFPLFHCLPTALRAVVLFALKAQNSPLAPFSAIKKYPGTVCVVKLSSKYITTFDPVVKTYILCNTEADQGSRSVQRWSCFNIHTTVSHL